MFKSLGTKINLTIALVLISCLGLFFIILDKKTINDLWNQKLNQARVIYQQLNFLKKWVGHQKGVWVKGYKSPIDNEHGFGRKNTSIILGELSQAVVGNKDYVFRVVSPKPINEKNLTTPFENKALMKLKMNGGIGEIYEIDENKQVFRYVKPMITSKFCISCHPNYTLGNVDGGISITIPISDVYLQIKKNRIYFLIFGIITVIVIIFVMITLMRNLVVTPIKILTEKTEKISIGEMNLSAEMDRDDEIGHLAKAVERLRISFKKLMKMK
jgi:methyl-accepting chemotaxis protein